MMQDAGQVFMTQKQTLVHHPQNQPQSCFKTNKSVHSGDTASRHPPLLNCAHQKNLVRVSVE